jgi:putative addiction module component (TIGR02574 family)
MASSLLKEQALRLPVVERLDLAESLLESVAQEDHELPAWQRQILDERLAEARRSPGEGVSWEDALAEIEQELVASQPAQ